MRRGNFPREDRRERNRRGYEDRRYDDRRGDGGTELPGAQQ